MLHKGPPLPLSVLVSSVPSSLVGSHLGDLALLLAVEDFLELAPFFEVSVTVRVGTVGAGCGCSMVIRV